MDSKKKVLFGLLIVFALVTAVIMYWLLKLRSVEIASAPLPSTERAEPAEAAPAPPPPAFEAKEITFSKSILFGQGYIEVDGAAPESVPCEQIPQLFGYLKIDGTTTAELTCKNDYLGGTQLIIKDASGESIKVQLQQSEGDAGDLWDSRSIITREKDGRLRIDTLSVSSREDIGVENAVAECSMRESSLVWDPATTSFVATDPKDLINLKMFGANILVAESCLNEKGEWK